VVKYTKAKVRDDGPVPPVELAIIAFKYRDQVWLDWTHGLIRKWTAMCAAAQDRARLDDVHHRSNSASEVCMDTPNRSDKNQELLSRHGFVSCIHKRPTGKPMPEHTRLANAQNSKTRSTVEHVFAHQKVVVGLFVRTIRLALARFKIWLSNLAYNMRRFVWLYAREMDAKRKWTPKRADAPSMCRLKRK
jgi:transposase, IS5 family